MKVRWAEQVVIKNVFKILVGKCEWKWEIARRHVGKGKRKECVRAWNRFTWLWITANLRIMMHWAYERQKLLQSVKLITKVSSLTWVMENMQHIYWYIMKSVRCPTQLPICSVRNYTCTREIFWLKLQVLFSQKDKHLYPKLNGYGDNGQRKVWSSVGSTHYTGQVRALSTLRAWVWCHVTEDSSG
jgi:hypothetical protein